MVKGKIEVSEPYIPHRRGDRVFYKRGTFYGVWVDDEIVPRLLAGDIRLLSISGVAVYDAVRGMFDTFVDKHYTIKQASSGTRYNNSKLRLNSAYGKFAQRARRKIVVTDPKTYFQAVDLIGQGADFRIDGKKVRLRNGVVYLELILPYEDRGRCTFIAAKITAKVRNKMVEEIIRPYNALYSDTDSGAIMFEHEFDPQLIDEKRLGAWKEETYNREFGDLITVHGAKDYEIRSIDGESGKIIEKRTHKGIPPHYVEDPPNMFKGRRVLKRREAEVMKRPPFSYVRASKRRLKNA